MLRIGVMAAVILINFSLQSTIFQYIEILGVKPNTSLIIIVSYSILRGDVEGAIVGFLSGLVQDLCFGSPYIGLYSLMGLLTGYVCGKPFKDFFRENFFLPLSLVAICSLLYQFVLYVVTFLFRVRLNFLFYFNTIIFPGSIYTTILAIPVYSLMYGVNSRLEGAERKKRKLF